VEKLDLPSFYMLGAALNPITRLIPAQTTWVQLFLWAVASKPAIEKLFADYPLEVCKNAGDEVLAEIAHWSDPANVPAATAGNTLNQQDQLLAQGLVNKVLIFENVLHAELRQLATYQVAKKGAYSTPELVERAENVFPPTIREKLPKDAVRDVRESGRCLAFDNPTASAFHIMRATETVMHEYYVKVCQPASKKRLDNWGAYIKALKDSGDVDAQEIVAIMQQIKDQHRNLIMHPEVFLDGDESFTLFQIAQGAIIAMAGKL